MQITMNETLRALRRKKEVTQEELAEHLGISPQAVSKWERGEGLPDIMLLPTIALYFGVTVDELLGVERARIEEKIAEYERRSMAFKNAGDMEKDCALWEEAYAEFPNEPKVASALIFAWTFSNKESVRARTVELGEEVLQNPRITDSERETVIQSLVYTYDALHDKEKALHYANRMNSIWFSREILRRHVLSGEEGCDANQCLIQNLIDLIRGSVGNICREGKYSPEERIRAWKSCIRIFEAVYEDGDYGFSASRMTECYRNLAMAYAKLGRADDCLDALEERAKFAVMCDTKLDMKHTSPLVNRQDYQPGTIIRNYAHNYSYEVAKGLKNKLWDFVRETPRFAAIVQSLEKVAK